MSKIETKLKSLTLNLKYGEKLQSKKTYIAKCTFRGKHSTNIKKYFHNHCFVLESISVSLTHIGF